MGGTVNISRNLFDSVAFRDEPFTEREAWVWLVMESSWKDRSVRAGDYVTDTERGQLCHSIRYMAKAWEWSPAKAQRYLNRLQKLKMICVKTDTGVTLVTICNYNKYQSRGKAADTESIQDRYGTDTEKKKDERKEEGNPIAPSASTPVRFDEFWEKFPHRGGAKKDRKASLQKYTAAVKRGVPEHEIIKGASRYGSDRQVLDGYGKGPVPWLNQECWCDDIETHKLKAIDGGKDSQARIARWEKMGR